MDNKIFEVIGETQEQLQAAISLIMSIGGDRTAKGFAECQKNGLVLSWFGGDNKEKIVPFPSELNAEEVTPIVWKWLQSEFAKTVELTEGAHDYDHDGHNSKGWLVYVESWGHVEPVGFYTICAIKPAYLWHGK